MNSSMVRYILGHILKMEALFMLLPYIVSLIHHEKEGFSYLVVSILCIFLGFAMSQKKPANTVFYLKEGCVATSLSWILLSFFGSIPFVLTGEIPHFIDALFETVSGFTTTGATILVDIEALSYTSLFWRNFTHWIGGMGVLVFLLAVIPMSGGSHINLMRAEITGPSVGKLVPKIGHSARILCFIYLGLTIIQIFFLLLGNIPLFEAITISFSTAGSGGFAVKNDSFASYSPYIQWVSTIFMILSGINFNAFFLLLFGKFKQALSMEEVRNYLMIIVAAITIVFLSIVRTSTSVFQALTDAAFQVAAIISSTGYATLDYNTWPQIARSTLVLLMFIGACAGSTGCGIKVSRITIVAKSVHKELRSYIHPKSIMKLKMDGKPIDHDIIRSINVYFATFIILFCGSLLLVSIENRDLVTTFTAVAATLNNTGPGFGEVGPVGNYSIFTPFSKAVFIFNMLAGRLELFPMLLLFHPAVWKDLFTQRNRVKPSETSRK